MTSRGPANPQTNDEFQPNIGDLYMDYFEGEEGHQIWLRESHTSWRQLQVNGGIVQTVSHPVRQDQFLDFELTSSPAWLQK